MDPNFWTVNFLNNRPSVLNTPKCTKDKKTCESV